MIKSALLVVHPTRPEALDFAKELIAEFSSVGIGVLTNYPGGVTGSAELNEESDFEIAIVLGGDGTILRAAELVLGKDIPILGINLGNVGFLAEITRPSAAILVAAVAQGNFRGEPRLLLQHEVLRDGISIANGWALNEFTIERSHAQMAELFVQIDDRPLSRWG